MNLSGNVLAKNAALESSDSYISYPFSTEAVARTNVVVASIPVWMINHIYTQVWEWISSLMGTLLGMWLLIPAGI